MSERPRKVTDIAAEFCEVVNASLRCGDLDAIDDADGRDNAPGESALFWSAHASTIDTAMTLAMPRYQDDVLH